MVTLDRWQTAQTYERSYWQQASSNISTGAAPQLDWYHWRAEQLAAKLNSIGLERLTDGTAKVLEVGSGPIGCVSFFPGVDRIAVDPLHDFFGADATLAALRDPTVRYLAGVGESVPCETESRDLVIIENCIDHVHNAPGVMRELNRVLKPGGVLYLTVNGRTRGGYYMHRALSRLRIDRGHPYTFTPDRATALVERYGMSLVSQEAGSAWAAHVEDLRGPAMKKRLKAVLGVSEYLISIFARKTASVR